jgi:hypothetical protein
VPTESAGDAGPGGRAAGVSTGELLRGWRERAMLTQEQVAELAGLNVRTIRRLDAGAATRPHSRSRAMAHVPYRLLTRVLRRPRYSSTPGYRRLAEASASCLSCQLGDGTGTRSLVWTRFWSKAHATIAATATT